jgi:predicted transcriptional regulator
MDGPEQTEPGIAPAPDRIFELSGAYWASRTLLSAVDLGVFAALAEGPLTAETLRERLDVHSRGARDFFDALVALGMLDRGDDGYRNTAETDLYLVPGKSSYLGGMLEFHSSAIYQAWSSLTETLRTGKDQRGNPDEQDQFITAYEDQDLMVKLVTAMSGYSAGPAVALATTFPWGEYQTFCDLGTAQGMVPVPLALHHQHLDGIGFDLPPVAPIFEKFVADHGLSSRVRFSSGDFFTDPLPPADVYVLGHVLHDWGLEAKRTLLRRAHDALPDGGVLVVYEMLIDDERRTNAAGLLMSLNMLVLSSDGFDYTGPDCRGWMSEAGFRRSYVQHLVGPESMVVGFK